jgi:hypothetical protein
MRLILRRYIWSLAIFLALFTPVILLRPEPILIPVIIMIAALLALGVIAITLPEIIRLEKLESSDYTPIQEKPHLTIIGLIFALSILVIILAITGTWHSPISLFVIFIGVFYAIWLSTRGGKK